MRRRPVIAVLGGSFNPPHLGHALIPTYVLARGLADRVIVAPCWSHPFAKAMASFEDRLTWTRVAMAVHGPAVEVSPIEAILAGRRGEGPSYTVELLEAIAAEHPGHDVRLVIGTDIVARGELDRWHRIDAIRGQFSPIVVPRAGFAPPEICALPEVSSTAVREWLGRAGDPEAQGRLAAALPAALLELLLAGRRGHLWLVGQGHVARHAEPWLRARGFTTRTIGARELIAGATPRRGEVDPDEPEVAGIWALCRDVALPRVAEALLRVDPAIAAAPVLTGSGALRADDPRALGALAAAGRSVGTLHPICSLRRERVAASALAEATFGVEGDATATALARRLCGDQPTLDLTGLDAGGRLAYHAACSLAANHLAVLYADGAAILTGLGHPEEAARRAIAALLRSSLDNLLGLEIPAGITGPVARGDQATIDGHLGALAGPTRELYALLSGRLAAIVAGARG
ncbi:MAG: DUF2520 domain-containing protein [Nannocystaceae bacterium]